MANKDKSDIQVETIGSRGKDSQRKLMIVVGCIIVAAVGINAFFAAGKDEPRRQDSGLPESVSFTPDGLEDQSFESETQTAIKSLRQGDSKLQAGVRANADSLEDVQRSQNAFREDMGKSLKAISDQLEDIRSEQAQLKSDSGGGNSGSNSTPPPDQPNASVDAVPPPPSFGGDRRKPGPPPSGNNNGQSTPPMVADKDEPMVLRPPEGSEDDGDVKVEVQRQPNPYAGFLSPGYVPVTLMTGVQAGTASVSQQNPSPILMRIQGNAQLAGSAEYDLRSCFMTGTSYGDARTHRAKIDIASISCVDKDNNLVLEETLTGYIADSDSIEGLRGTLREKRGAVLAKATLASMLESLGTAFSEAQGTAFDSVTGGGSVIEGDAALRSSGLSAAASGAKTLSDFYLQELERLFPVIEVPANRKAFAVITKGKALKWNDYGSLFVEKTQPL